jgi:hypothetical protein
MTIAIDAKLRAALKAEAACDRVTMVEKLHQVLCEALDRPDLMEVSQPEVATA